jgi:hypothetical protein
MHGLLSAGSTLEAAVHPSFINAAVEFAPFFAPTLPTTAKERLTSIPIHLLHKNRIVT